MSEAIWRRADGGSPGSGRSREQANLAELLDSVQQMTIALLGAMPGQARRLVVRAGDIEVDMDWELRAPLVGLTALQPETPVAPGLMVATTPADTPGFTYVCAPSVGTFYRAPEPGAAPYVTEDSPVEPGQTVGIVEAMKLMLPVESAGSGQVSEFLVADGEPVEFGQRLIAIAAG